MNISHVPAEEENIAMLSSYNAMLSSCKGDIAILPSAAGNIAYIEQRDW